MKQPSLGYAYVDTRIRVMGTHLISRPTYQKLLGMRLSELTLFLENQSYRKEIDELAPYHKGVDLIEYALAKNLANTFSRIKEFLSGKGRTMIEAYLGRFDAWNIKVVIRGLYAGAKPEEILRDIIPVGKYNKEFFVKLLSEAESIEDIPEILKGTAYRDAVSVAMPSYIKNHSLSPIEDAIDKAYFEWAIGVASKELRDILSIEADIANLMALLRLKKIGMPAREEIFIKGGKNFTPAQLENMSKLDYLEIVDKVQEALQIKPVKQGGQLRELHIKLNSALMSFARGMLFDYKVGIKPILGYIAAKKIETDNLRVLVRGKNAGLPSEKILEQMVI